MGLLTVLQYVTNALFVGLAGICFLQWLRRRGRATAWLAATFGALAVVVLASAALEAAGAAERAAGWVLKPLVAALFLFPYLLFRFTVALEGASRRTEAVAGALAGMVALWTALLPPLPAQGEPLPGWLRAYLAAVVVQWTVVSLIVAVKLWRAGRGQPVAARQRMRGLSLAATGLSVVIVIGGLAPSSGEPGPLAVPVQALILACTLLFYLAFAPPALVRGAWRHREQEMLRRAMGDLKAANRVEDVADVMLPHVTSMVGGRGAALLDLALINEVLDIAAIEAGRLPLSLEPVGLADVVGEAMVLIRPLADQHNVLLVGSPTGPGDQHVLADRQRLKQVLLNLLSNAIKYNRPGGTVRLDCEPVAGKRLRVKVADTGPGIAPEALERLFVPFERLTAEFSGWRAPGWACRCPSAWPRRWAGCWGWRPRSTRAAPSGSSCRWPSGRWRRTAASSPAAPSPRTARTRPERC